MTGTVLVYGAYGYTGRLIVEELVRRELRPIVAGRDPARVGALAQHFGLVGRVAPIDRIRDHLDEVDALVLATSSFGEHAGSVADACVARKCHYLDVSGEYESIMAVQARHVFAQARGVMLMPGVGFDVVASDCLAVGAARACRRPEDLQIALSGLTLVSRGSAKTLARQMGQPVMARRGGSPVPLRGSDLVPSSFTFPSGVRSCIPVTWGDIATAPVSTGIPDVTTYFEATAPVMMTTALGQLGGAWFQAPFVQQWLGYHAELLPPGPTQSQRRSRQVEVAVRVRDGRRIASAHIRAPEAYTFTARSAAQIVARVARGDIEPGFQTPGRVYGPGLLAQIEGVEVAGVRLTSEVEAG